MSEEIIKVLDYITEKLGVAIDWTAENALPYVEEILGKYVTYNIVKCSIGVAFGLLAILLLIGFCIIINKSEKKCERIKENTFWFLYIRDRGAEFDDEFVALAAVIFGVLIGTGIALIGCNAGDLLKWSIVPEIAMLEEIQALIG